MFHLRTACLALLVSLSFPSLFGLDLNQNGISDVWEFTYNATLLDRNIDSDGDGATNYQESTAGTDPNNSKSVLTLIAKFGVGSNWEFQ